MSDGGKGSSPRPIPDYDSYSKNWDSIFNKRSGAMVRVSGVPYEVDLDGRCPNHDLGTDDMIATLEQENKYMRARMDRLEEDCRNLEEVIHKLNMELWSLKGDNK